VRCGSPGPLVAFDLEEGGTLCRACRRGVPISDEALELVRRVLGGDLVSVLGEAATPATHEVEVLATKSMEHHLERRLRSVGLL
jgi:DNA repair protein RecO (recombination protein O)